jgi:hypothetical protein
VTEVPKPTRDIRASRWRATVAVEFTSHDYEHSEQATAMHQSDMVVRAGSGAERDVNCSRPVVLLTNLERLDG